MPTINKQAAPLPPPQWHPGDHPREQCPTAHCTTQQTPDFAELQPQYAPASVFGEASGQPAHNHHNTPPALYAPAQTCPQPAPVPQEYPLQGQYPKPQQQDRSAQTEPVVFKDPEQKVKPKEEPIQWHDWNSTFVNHLCDGCEPCDAGCEISFCSPMHAAAQCGRLSESHLATTVCCLGICFGDCCVPNPVIPGLGTRVAAVVLRMRIRDRYKLRGNWINDISVGLCCPLCVHCQNYREMSKHHEKPSGPFCTAT